MQKLTIPKSFMPRLPAWTTLTGVLVLALLVAVTSWHYADRRAAGKIVSFSQCHEASGSLIQESYPEVCVTRDGKRFPNPDQHVVLPPDVSKESELYIQEWGVRLTIAAPGAYYTLNNNGTAYISTHDLENLRKQILGCSSGMHGITTNRDMKEARLIEPMCAVETSTVTQKIAALQQSIRDALRSPTKL
jgi:hypothetical protein